MLHHFLLNIKGEILSGIACQLGLTEGGGVAGAEETGQRVMSFLGTINFIFILLFLLRLFLF